MPDALGTLSNLHSNLDLFVLFTMLCPEFDNDNFDDGAKAVCHTEIVEKDKHRYPSLLSTAQCLMIVRCIQVKKVYEMTHICFQKHE